MTTKTDLPTDGTFVTFDQPGDGVTIGRCHIKLPVPVYSPYSFDDYRKEARMVLRVLKGESKDDEHLRLPEFGYNAMGCNTFLAALAYEILEQESHL